MALKNTMNVRYSDPNLLNLVFNFWVHLTRSEACIFAIRHMYFEPTVGSVLRCLDDLSQFDLESDLNRGGVVQILRRKSFDISKLARATLAGFQGIRVSNIIGSITYRGDRLKEGCVI